jgi:hypothetical protein
VGPQQQEGLRGQWVGTTTTSCTITDKHCSSSSMQGCRSTTVIGRSTRHLQQEQQQEEPGTRLQGWALLQQQMPQAQQVDQKQVWDGHKQQQQ